MKIIYNDEDKKLMIFVKRSKSSHNLLDTIANLRMFIINDPDNAFSHYMLGNALYASGNLSEAKLAWQEVLRLDHSETAALARERLDSVNFPADS